MDYEQLNRENRNILVLYFIAIIGYGLTGALMMVIPIQNDQLLAAVILIAWMLITALFLGVLFQMNRLSTRAMEREAAARSAPA